MASNGELLPTKEPIRLVTRESGPEGARAKTLATRDHEVIRQWAARRKAEPATGEATSSGPATIDVKDGGAGVRFNFPGITSFRPIAWDEWFENFDGHDLTFVYEEDAPSGTVSARYRIVRAKDWKDRVNEWTG